MTLTCSCSNSTTKLKYNHCEYRPSHLGLNRLEPLWGNWLWQCPWACGRGQGSMMFFGVRPSYRHPCVPTLGTDVQVLALVLVLSVHFSSSPPTMRCSSESSPPSLWRAVFHPKIQWWMISPQVTPNCSLTPSSTQHHALGDKMRLLHTVGNPQPHQ